VEKLHFVVEFAIFVETDCSVGTLAGHVLEKGVNNDTLNVLAVSFEGLNLGELIMLNRPQNACAVQTARDQILRIR